jgi:hypothetical protein
MDPKCDVCGRIIYNESCITDDKGTRHISCPSEAERSGGVQPCFLSATSSAVAGADAPKQVDELARSFRAGSGPEADLKRRLAHCDEVYTALTEEVAKGKWLNAADYITSMVNSLNHCEIDCRYLAANRNHEPKDAPHCKGERALARNSD